MWTNFFQTPNARKSGSLCVKPLSRRKYTKELVKQMCGEIGGHGNAHWDFYLLDLSIWADLGWVICPHFKAVTPPRANLDFLLL
jgi:hypothetical protein